MRFVLLNKNKWLKPITTVKKKTNVCELMKPHHVHMFLCQVYQSRLLSFNLRDSTHSYPCLMPLFWFITLHRGYGCKNYIQFVCTLLVLHFPHQTWHALSNLQICRLKSNIDSSQLIKRLGGIQHLKVEPTWKMGQHTIKGRAGIIDTKKKKTKRRKCLESAATPLWLSWRCTVSLLNRDAPLQVAKFLLQNSWSSTKSPSHPS